MLPLTLSFRRLLLNNIPQLTSEKIDRFESLIALRHQTIQEINILPDPADVSEQNTGKQKNPSQKHDKYSGDNGDIDSDPQKPKISREPLVQRATVNANAIFEPCRQEYEAVCRLYIARRQLALKQGRFLQIPPTFGGLIDLFQAILGYRKQQFKAFPRLALNRIRYFFRESSWEQWAEIAVIGFLIVLGVLALLKLM